MPVVADLFHPGTSRDPNRLLIVGKLTEQKRLHHLLKAMSLARTRATLDVVGAGRVQDSHLQDMAASLGLADRITWHPLLTQAELAVLYRTAAVHVIPALDEGLGLTAVEALLSETPVIAFDSGGIPDIVRPDRTGVLVPPGDVAGLARAIDRMLGDAALRDRLGGGGRAYAMEHFGPAAVAASYARLLRSASATGKGKGR